MSSEKASRRTAAPVRRAPGRIAALAGAVALALTASAMPAAASGSGAAWYLDRFGMSSVWHTSKGSGVVVAEVGTGVNAADPDLSGRVQKEIGLQGGAVKAASGDSSSTYDGTRVAALLAGLGTAGSRVSGLAPATTVLPIQIQDSSANGIAASAAEAIHYAVAHNARIILFPAPLPRTSAAFEAAVKFAVSNNAIVIAGSGNNGSDAVIGDPCAAAGALCISATTSSDSPATLSSIGPDVTLAAPGTQIPVPARNGSVSTDSSTHYSAALAAGEAALVWAAHPTWSAGQVVRVMLNTAKGGNAQHTRVNDSIGYGIINPAAAVAASEPAQVTNPLLPVVPTASASAGPSASAGASATAATAPARPSAASSSSSGPWLWVGLGIAALILVGGVAVMILRNRPHRRRNYIRDTAYLAPTHQVQPPNSWPPNQAWPQPDQTPYPGLPGTPPAGWPPQPQPSPLPWPNDQQTQASPLPWPPAPPTPPPGGPPAQG